MVDNSLLEKGGYAECSDEQLAAMAKKNDGQAVLSLISRYICAVEAKARSFSGGVYDDDLIQEGLMGLMSAIQSFEADKEVRFGTYAMTCVKNRMISALKKDRAILEEAAGEDDEPSHDPSDIPENIVLEKERMNEIFEKIYSALSELEWRVFQLYLSGLAYNQIALKLSVSVKAVDNAMQRVRRKLKAVLR
ncbi:sigma-70 family RNA polymerase sigma factor [Ruminococcus sp. Marseille-P6503]|uniref:sigma-70 family RNA polymerase sigma factor n=1 Tax=Ruminococcus sp. Marseille-P6503 TaxID=2364796 RepID=UPI0013DDBD84|nr:sigma-70 family RNA polymerase sigma factor [Ruminococcus sp. Marseille-P6503]